MHVLRVSLEERPGADVAVLVEAALSRPRLGLTASETETAAWLVEHHLAMSLFAQSRDLNDPKTLRDFAALVQSRERLKLLLVLTVADIRAVGPGVWNGWKGQLLRSLFWETELVLAGGHSNADRRASVRHSQEELRAALTDWSPEEIEAYVGRHYPPYWLKVDLPTRLLGVAIVLSALAMMALVPRSLAARWRTPPE